MITKHIFQHTKYYKLVHIQVRHKKFQNLEEITISRKTAKFRVYKNWNRLMIKTFSGFTSHTLKREIPVQFFQCFIWK